MHVAAKDEAAQMNDVNTEKRAPTTVPETKQKTRKFVLKHAQMEKYLDTNVLKANMQ